MADHFGRIEIAGGDTAMPLSMAKRLEVVRRHIQPSAGRFLDCGCGSGQYVLELTRQLGLDAHGVEFNEAKVAAAHQQPDLRTRVSRGNVQALASSSEAWDYAMLNEVLEHVPDDRAALAEVYRVLKPGGILFIFSPNRWFPFESHGVRLKRPDWPVPHWVPLVPYVPLRVGRLFLDYWARNYWPGELASKAKAQGFAVIERSFIWPTLENISGQQPGLIRLIRPQLRKALGTFERLPIIRRLGVSQVLVCRKERSNRFTTYEGTCREKQPAG